MFTSKFSYKILMTYPLLNVYRLRQNDNFISPLALLVFKSNQSSMEMMTSWCCK